jgi:hypothetical protein
MTAVTENKDTEDMMPILRTPHSSREDNVYKNAIKKQSKCQVECT